MNRDELEDWMKDSLGRQEFVPGDAGWKKFQEALNPGANEKKKRLFLFHWPKAVGIAASVALLLAVGSSIYIMNRKGDPNQRIALVPKPLPPVPQAFRQVIANRDDSRTSARSGPQNDDSEINRTSTGYMVTHEVNPGAFADKPTGGQSEYAAEQHFRDSANHIVNAPVPPGRGELFPDRLFADEKEGNKREKVPAVNLGVAAQFGKASVGSTQYQLGVVARTNLSPHLYAEAVLVFSATAVRNVQTSNFQSLSTGSTGTNSIENRTIEARYGSNILAVGIFPAIGYRLNHRLSVSCGMSLYRNINQSLSLTNSAQIEASALENDVISDTRQVSRWDAGFTGSAACNISPRLIIQAQYRYGASAFIYSNNEALRNSGFNIGLRYSFTK